MNYGQYEILIRDAPPVPFLPAPYISAPEGGSDRQNGPPKILIVFYVSWRDFTT